MKQHVLKRVLVAVLAGAGLVCVASPQSNGSSPTGSKNSFAYPTSSHPFGSSYAEWSAEWWKWCMELPVEDHPSTETDAFDVTAGQAGKVWFLAAPVLSDPDSSVTRACTIPAGKALFLPLICAEWSSLEGASSLQEEQETAAWQADHIVPGSLFCTLDGAVLSEPTDYRFMSPQLAFEAPTPWLFGDTGGFGTAVGDGYYVFLKQLAPGQHTLHYGGMFHFTLEDDGFDFDGWIDMTYEITQLGGTG
jgi:hypothetical protein